MNAGRKSFQGRFGWLPIAVSLCSLLAAGCGAPHEEEPMPVEESVFGEQVKQMDKAREQAENMEARMDDLNQQLEDMGQ